MADSVSLSLDPRFQAGAIVVGAERRRRPVVHTVIDASAAPIAQFAALGAAGSDIVSFRVGPSDDAEMVAEAVAGAAEHMAVGLRFEGAPELSMVERCIARGVTYLGGSPVGLLALGDAAGSPAIIEAYRQIDRLAAAPGDISIVREVVAPPVVAPPAVLLSALLADMAITADAGVPIIALAYPAMGSLVQDVAALAVLRRLGDELLAARGRTSRLVISVALWVGAPDPIPTNRFAIASAAAMAAGLGGADQALVGALGSLRSATDASLLESVSTTRQMLDMLVDQRLEPSGQWTAERDAVEAEVRERLAGLLTDENAAEAPASMAIAGLGLRDVASDWARRDSLGAVRLADGEGNGAWPVWTDSPGPVVREHAKPEAAPR